jgi:hypothetical protein
MLIDILFELNSLDGFKFLLIFPNWINKKFKNYLDKVLYICIYMQHNRSCSFNRK